MPCADNSEMPLFHVSKSNKKAFALLLCTRCHIQTIVQDSGQDVTTKSSMPAWPSLYRMNTAQSGIFMGKHRNVGHSGAYGSQRRGASTST